MTSCSIACARRPASAPAAGRRGRSSPSSRPRSFTNEAPLALFVTGLISLVAQIVLLRELSVAFYGVELVYLLALGAWLLGSGTGAAVGPPSRPAGERGLALLFLAFGALVPVDVALLRGARRLLGGMSGAFLPFDQGLVVLVAAIVPIAALAGLLFAWAARAAVRRGATFARAYAIESAGGLAGGLAATLALAVGARATVLACACSLAACAAAAWLARGRSRRVGASALISAALATAGLAGGAYLDRATARWNHPQLVETGDSPYARLIVTRALGQVSLFANDALVFESESVDAESFVQPVLLQHAAPRRIAILGGALQGLAAEALKHRPERLDAVEMDATARDLALEFLPPAQTAVLSNPSVRLAHGDPRGFLSRAEGYDAILVGVSDPDSGQTNRFYTREFFEECAEHLGERGVLGLRLRSAENFWTPLLARRMASIQRALEPAFRHVLWLPGAVNVVVASQAPLTDDADALADRLEARGVSCRLVSRPYLRYVMTNARGPEIAARLAATQAPANADVRPVCYTYAAALWLSKFFPRIGFADLPWPEDAGRGRWLWAPLALAVPFALLRFRARARSAALAFVAGLSGMVVESVLLLYYQARLGALFQDVGVLLAAFMCGLALGAWVFGRASGPTPEHGARRFARGAVVLFLMASLSLAIACETRAALIGGRVGVGLLLLACGSLVGALLAHASRGGGDQERLVAPLYAADLLGGCLGAVAGSLFMIPLLGLAETCQAVAALVLAAIVLA